MMSEGEKYDEFELAGKFFRPKQSAKMKLTGMQYLSRMFCASYREPLYSFVVLAIIKISKITCSGILVLFYLFVDTRKLEQLLQL